VCALPEGGGVNGAVRHLLLQDLTTHSTRVEAASQLVDQVKHTIRSTAEETWVAERGLMVY